MNVEGEGEGGRGARAAAARLAPRTSGRPEPLQRQPLQSDFLFYLHVGCGLGAHRTPQPNPAPPPVTAIIKVALYLCGTAPRPDVRQRRLCSLSPGAAEPAVLLRVLLLERAGQAADRRHTLLLRQGGVGGGRAGAGKVVETGWPAWQRWRLGLATPTTRAGARSGCQLGLYMRCHVAHVPPTPPGLASGPADASRRAQVEVSVLLHGRLIDQNRFSFMLEVRL